MTENNIKIRHAILEDVYEILHLLSALEYPCELETLKERYTRFLSHSGYGIAVCEINHHIEGFIAWSKSELFVSDHVRFHIESIIVSHHYKGKGIGKKLIQFIENIAKKHSPAFIDLTSGLRRAKDGTHEFYKKLGYSNEGHMAKLYLKKEF